MIDEAGRKWIPRNRAALAEGIADALLNRDDAETWDEMAEVVIKYLCSVGIQLPPFDDLPPVWGNPIYEENTKSAAMLDMMHAATKHLPAAAEAFDSIATHATAATNIYESGLISWGVINADGTTTEFPPPISIEFDSVSAHIGLSGLIGEWQARYDPSRVGVTPGIVTGI